MSQNRLCERSAAISILAPASAPEIASGVRLPRACSDDALAKTRGKYNGSDNAQYIYPRAKTGKKGLNDD